MNKNTLVIVLAGVIVVIGVLLFLGNRGNRQPAQSTTQTPAAFDPTNATYSIDGNPVTLVNGKASTPAAPGSATQVTTFIFGQPTSGDLNSDGKADAAMILVQNPGGSGTFYYIAAAINATSGTKGTNAILLGDRIAPQNIEIQNGQIIANYADRAAGQPMSTAPSVGVTKYFSLNGTTLVESAPIVGAGAHCGGNLINAPICGVGFHCVLAPGSHLPFGDVGGVCVAN